MTGSPAARIAVVLTGGERGPSFRAALRTAGYVELRIDRFLQRYPDGDVSAWIVSVRNMAAGRMIGTVRWHREQPDPVPGLPDKKRLALYRSVLPLVDLCDVEVASRIAPAVIALARRHGRKVILSHHDFRKTPPFRTLQGILRSAQIYHGDIVKIATLVASAEELKRLVRFTDFCRGRMACIVVPMGVSVRERMAPLAHGSLVAYAALDERTAPGQPGWGTVKAFLERRHHRRGG